MEKNTVCMDLINYNQMLLLNREMREELWDLKKHTIPTLKEEVNVLKEALVVLSIDDFNISHYRLEQLIDFENVITCGVGNRRKQLNALGIEDEFILSIIREAKENYETKVTKGK